MSCTIGDGIIHKKYLNFFIKGITKDTLVSTARDQEQRTIK